MSTYHQNRPSSIFLFYLVQPSSLSKFVILGDRHRTKKADPVYPTPGRDQRGKHTEKCWQHADESVFISTPDISDVHLTFVFLYLINISTIHVQKRTFNLHTQHVPPQVFLKSINCIAFHLDAQKPRGHSRFFPFPYPQQPIYSTSSWSGLQNKIPATLLTTFCSML